MNKTLLNQVEINKIISKILKSGNRIDDHREFGTEDWMNRYMCDLESAERLIAQFNDRMFK